jgi:hypothetical protein
MSRLPFASGKYSPCSSPTSVVAASAIRELASRSARIGRVSRAACSPVAKPFSKRRTMQRFWNGFGCQPLLSGSSISLHSQNETSPKPVLFR